MDFLFNENDIFPFIFYLKPLLPLEGGLYLKKSYASGNRFRYFFQTLIQMKQCFGPLKSYFSSNPSFWHEETVFG